MTVTSLKTAQSNQSDARRVPALVLVSIISVFALLFSLPLFVSPISLNYVIKMMVAGLFALAFNVLWSHARLLSFGHAAYYAIGAFAVIHALSLSERGVLSIPTPLVPVMGLIAGALVGLVIGYLATVRGGTYFAMITLAVGELLFSIAPKWEAVFGGESGLSSMRMPWAGFTFSTVGEVYIVVLVWCLLGLALLRWFSATPLGQIAVAVGDNEKRLQFLGYRTHAVKTVVFSLSAAVSGLSGGLIAFTMESASFELFGGSHSAMPVMHAFLGGADVFLGPVVGGIGLTLFSELASNASRLWLLYMGVIFVIVVMFAPEGLAGIVSRHAKLGLTSWRPLIADYALFLSACAGLVLSGVWIAEVSYRLMGTSPIVGLAPDGMVTLFERTFSATSKPLWSAAIALFLLSLFGVLTAAKRAKATWLTIDENGERRP
jgi:branched-chain amino acid transport system permease protein